MHQPVLLDLFCGGGGAGVGYASAGFSVVGVDLDDHPEYPFAFYRADALEILPYLVERYRPVAIHASPPCQASSPTSAFRRRHTMRNPSTADPVNLIPATRDALDATGLPYVIENVAYHRTGLRDPLTLCGASFGLIVYRHRWFEFGGGWVKPPAPEHRPHSRLTMRNGYLPDADRPMMTITGRNGHHSKAWVRAAANAMGTYWLANNLNSVCEAIPPAYTQYIGSAFMERDR